MVFPFAQPMGKTISICSQASIELAAFGFRESPIPDKPEYLKAFRSNGISIVILNLETASEWTRNWYTGQGNRI